MPVNKVLSNPRFTSSVLETMEDGVMVVDRDGIILSLNPAAERMTGYATEEVAGRSCAVLDTDVCTFMDVDGKKVRCTLFEDGKTVRKRCRIRAKDGREIYLLKNASVLRDDEGRIVAGIETMTDVTSLVMKEREVEELRLSLSKDYGFMGLVGTSPTMKRAFEQIQNAARSEAPAIVLGESGTGKELAAAAIHALSRRKDGPFVTVNCAALNEHVLESEIFGHRKGSFTGAVRDREGRFEAAGGGSIFIDEVGDMPPAVQVKLLRVIEQKEVERVGDNAPVPVDIRLITATNQDLERLVAEGRFREDLLYRVNVIPVRLPPLRERPEDLPLLVNHFLRKIAAVNSKDIRRLSPEALAAMQAYSWPGNVRQLINALEYAAITARGRTVEAGDLPDYLLGKPRGADPPARGRLDRQAVEEALARHGGSRTRAASHLGVSRVTLWKRMKEWGIT